MDATCQARHGAFESLAALAAFLAAAGGTAGGLRIAVLDLALDDRIGRQAAGGFSSALAFGLVANEFAGRFSLAALARPAANLAGVWQPIAGNALCAHVGDRAVRCIPSGALVERIGCAAFSTSTGWDKETMLICYKGVH